MLGKIILIAIALAVAVLLIRLRLRRQSVGGDPTAAGSTRMAFRLTAYSLIAVMLGGSLIYLFLDWRASQQVIQVRVINAYTGERVSYQARRGDVLTRHFKTLDGRMITLAEVERLELEGGD